MSAILAIDAAGPTQAGIAVAAADGSLLSRQFIPGRPGLIETLPVLLQACVEQAGARLAAVAVSIGPGSFTGLRTAIALAQGYAAASGLPLYGIEVDEAFQIGFPGLHRPLWVAIRARRGRIFLLRNGVAQGFADADIPQPNRPVAVAGDAANEVAASLAARGRDVLLTNARRLDPAWVAAVARAQMQAGQAPRAALPVYVDAPEAALPPGGLRPAPV